MEESMNGIKPIQVRVDPDLRRRFKTVCSEQGRSMSEVLREFVTWYTARKEGERV